MELVPCEVLERILSFTDAVTLCICRRVCRRWREAADFLQGAAGYWMMTCLRLINRNCLVELVGQAHGGVGQQQPGKDGGESRDHREDDTFDIEKLDWVDWEKIFNTWMRGQTITKFTAVTTRVGRGDVSCLAVSGSYIISGHVSGHRNIWESSSQDLVTCSQVHAGEVRALALVDLLHQPPYHSGLLHHALVSGGADGCLIVSVLLDQYGDTYRLDQEIKIRQHSQAITSVTILGSMMAVLSKENRVSLWSLSAPASESTLPVLECLMMIPGPPEQLITARIWSNMLVFWMQKIVCIDARCQSRQFPLGGDPGARRQWEKHKQFTLIRPVSREESLAISEGVWRIRSSHLSDYFKDVIVESQPEADGPWFTSRKFVSAWVFHDDIFALVSQDSHLYLSVDGVYYRDYSIEQHYGSNISTITVYTNTLTLGTQAGEVIIYQISDAIDIIDLDLAKPVWRASVSSSPLTSLVMGVVRGTMALVTGGQEGMTLTMWESQVDNKREDKHVE